MKNVPHNIKNVKYGKNVTKIKTRIKKLTVIFREKDELKCLP